MGKTRQQQTQGTSNDVNALDQLDNYISQNSGDVEKLESIRKSLLSSLSKIENTQYKLCYKK